MSTLALIGLGSNLGDRAAALSAAVAALEQSEGILVRAVSRHHQTHPVGGPAGQGAFLNAAVAIETTLDAAALLHRLHAIETGAGRTRTVRWGERTLDLDLLLFGDTILEAPNLVLPHPRMSIRRFVLGPLAEIAPDVRDPLTSRSIRDLLANLDRRPSYLALEGWWRHVAVRPTLERIVEGLNTFCWSYHDLIALTPALPRPWKDRPIPSLLEALEPDRWSMLEEQWIVTDFTAAELVRDGSDTWPDLAALNTYAPTFVVEPPGTLQLAVMGQPQHGSTPRIRLRTGTPEEQSSEVLAACLATRP